MPDIKNKNEQNLKSVDSKKLNSQRAQMANLTNETFTGKKGSDKGLGSNAKSKKKLPLAVDVIIGILMIIIACVIIIGSYTLFKYYSNDQKGVQVEYKIICTPNSDFSEYVTMKNEDLYLDGKENSYYFGEITNIEMREASTAESNQLILTVSAVAKYQVGSGYSLAENRLAVGSEFDLRCLDTYLKVVVVELNIGSEGGK